MLYNIPTKFPFIVSGFVGNPVESLFNKATIRAELSPLKASKGTETLTSVLVAVSRM